MFYIKEIYLRLIYIILLVFFLFFIHYQYKEIILIIFLIPSKLMGYELVEHFIYTHPTELIHALLNLSLFFVIIFLLPYVIWLVLDFLKPGLYLNEYNKLKNYTQILLLVIILLNIFLFTLFFPVIFKFFQSFNSLDLKNLDIKFELKIFEFICFIYNIFFVINTGLFFLLIIFLTIIINGVVFYIRYKKIFLVFNIMIATFLSTPDIGSQIILFILLNIFLELFQIIIVYQNKINTASY